MKLNKQYHNFKWLRVTPLTWLTIVCVSLLLILSGCLAPVEKTATESQSSILSSESEPDASQTTPTKAVRPDSGFLRLAWSDHSTLNPLLDFSISGQAAQTLVFESLFVRDANFALKNQLVENYSFSQDRLQLTLLIDTTATFHNQQQLTASDVLACLNFIRQQADRSPYSDALSAFANGYLVNDETLVLQLDELDPDFLNALTFPIIPANQLNLPKGSLFAGTGRYQMIEFTPEKNLILRWADKKTIDQVSLKEIRLQPYDTTIEAMKALEDDELDLVDLNESDLSYYQNRNSLRLDRFIGNRYIDLVINPIFQYPANNPNAQINQKYFFRSARLFSQNIFWPGQLADVPIPSNHACFEGQPFSLYDPNLSDDQKSADLGFPKNRLLRVITSDDQSTSGQIADLIASWLSQSGYLVDVLRLKPDVYKLAMAQQDYDIIIRETEIPPSMDPSWLYSAQAENPQGLNSNAVNGYDEGQVGLTLGRPFFDLLGRSPFESEAAKTEAAANFRNALTTAALQSPSIGLMLREKAIAYGDRVQGQCQPSLFQPYYGIEDLWIWSGLSSSPS